MDEEYELQRDSEIKKEINNIIWMYGKKDMTLEKAENLACFVHYAIKGDIKTAVSFLGFKSFEEHWGDRGERWNGILDIKNWSKEIWEAARETNI